MVWKLYMEHAVKPPVQFFETKPHPNKASALKRALAIYRNPAWGLKVLFIEGSNGERMESCGDQDLVRARRQGPIEPSLANGDEPLPAALDRVVKEG